LKPWAGYLICGLAGILAGAGGAVWSVRAGALGAQTRIGAWTTGADFGTAEASARTRAVVALRGLLALPAREARYYNAAVDDAGRPLDGRCRYAVTGGDVPGAWWSLTLYDPEGYLVPNPAGIYSVESAAVPDRSRWAVAVAPDRQPGAWLPTGGKERFELTLRVYLPNDGGRGNLTAAQLPRIVRQGCA
jgi:hypothetical protein